MELPVLAATWWIVGFSGAMMPGPVTTLIVSTSARRGFIAGPLITLGHVALELVMVVALFFGLGDLLKQNLIQGLIGLLGGIFLLWMGWDIVESAWSRRVSLSLSGGREDGSLSGRNPIAAGVLASISNPYWLFWWATVGAASLITFRSFGWAGIAAFYFGHTLADWVWNDLVAFIVASGRKLMTDRLYRSILLVCGVFLIGISVYFISSGIEFLIG